MGIDRQIKAALPEPDLRLVAHVLDHWRRHDPDQFMLARFGLDHIGSSLRSRTQDLEDGLAGEMRWICFGCRFDFIYGFHEGLEVFIVTGLAGWNHDPRCETIRKRGHVVFAPGSMTFCRLPQNPRRVLNRIPDGFGHVSDAFGRAPLATSGQAPRTAAGFNELDGEFAPPWLPGDYLHQHVPKRGGRYNFGHGRAGTGRTQEFAMEKIDFASMLFATRSLQHLETIQYVDDCTMEKTGSYFTGNFGLMIFDGGVTLNPKTGIVDAGLDIGEDDDRDGARHLPRFDRQTGQRSCDGLIAPQT